MQCAPLVLLFRNIGMGYGAEKWAAPASPPLIFSRFSKLTLVKARFFAKMGVLPIKEEK